MAEYGKKILIEGLFIQETVGDNKKGATDTSQIVLSHPRSRDSEEIKAVIADLSRKLEVLHDGRVFAPVTKEEWDSIFE
jgi:hypothetical protein